MPNSAALLVIDAQESFRQRPFFRDEDVPSWLSRQQALINGALQAGVPVLQIFHQSESGPFSLASGYVVPWQGLSLAPASVFYKQRHSALIGTGLDVWLVCHGIRHLAISGLRTEQCCETTTRHASDMGWSVDFVSEATLTFPMTDAAGRIWSSQEIRACTELVLADRFARIATVDQALTEFAQYA